MSSTVFYELRGLVWANKAAAKKRFTDDPNLRYIRSSLGETLLHWFAVENCQEEIAWLMEQGVPLNTITNFGSSPLVEVIELGYTELALFLLEIGADPRPINNLEETALSIAQERGNTTLILHLEAALLEWADLPETNMVSATEERLRLDAWLKKSRRKPRR